MQTESLWKMYIGVAVSEITDLPNPAPQVEKFIPEVPIPRTAITETDITGATPVLTPETDRELKELYDNTKLAPNLMQYHKCLDNYPLEVVIPELTPIYTKNGAIIDEKTRLPLFRAFEYSYFYPYAKDGKPFTGKITESPSVRCYYLGNRNASVPHITMGEQVLVFQYYGNGIFYWKELGRDNNLPRIEKYRIFCNDQQAVTKKPDVIAQNTNRPNDDNSYYLEFDTINKHILLATANTDGEKVRYWFKMNPKDMTCTLWDDDGNRIQIDSKEHRIYMRNMEQTTVELHKSHINMWSADSINIESDTINLIGRVNYNETVGVLPEYKAKQIAAKLHQKENIASGPVLHGGDKVFAPLTGVGNKIKNVATQETFTTPTKVDTITSWTITNQTYKFLGNLIEVIGAKAKYQCTENSVITTKNTVQMEIMQLLYKKFITVTGSSGSAYIDMFPTLNTINFTNSGSHPWIT